MSGTRDETDPQVPRPRLGSDPPARTGASFVGRARELGVLEAALARARDGAAGTVVVRADAGVGKSRLMEEFRLRAEQRGARVLAGACVSFGAGVIPYAPLIDALRRLVRERGDEAFRKASGPAYPELANLVSDFSGTGSPAEPTTEQRVFGAILRLLDRLGADAPVALIIEDLHWADPSTLDLVAYLARAQTTERSLLVCTYRSDPPEQVRTMLDELVRAVRSVERIEMSPFTRDELRVFLAADDEAANRCFDLSGGNAFYAEELTHAGLLEASWQGRASLPGSVSELVTARVERLNGDAQRVIRIAATAGRRVSHRLLATVSELGKWDLIAAVRQCSEQRLLESEPTGGTYVFRHALVREAVYQGLVAGERIILHEAMAEALTADVGLSYAADLSVASELAHHWEQAESLPRALAATVRAGDAAAGIRAFAAAETHYDRALRLWGTVPGPEPVTGRRHDEILAAAADAARWAGHANRAVVLVKEALAEVDHFRNPRRAGELHERLGSYLWEAGNYEASRRAYSDALGLLSGESSALAARVLAGLATATVRLGRYTPGLAEAEAAVLMAAEVGALAEEGRAHNTAGVALTLLGNDAEGVERCRRALRIAQSVDHLEDLFRAYSNLVFVLENADRLEEAVEQGRDGLARAEALGVERTRQGLVLANNAAAALAVLGRWGEAIEMLNDALRHDPPVEESRYPRLTLAEILIGQGEFAAARTLIEPLPRDRDSIRQPNFGGPLHACLAELAIEQGDTPGARRAVDAGIEVARGGESRLILLRLCALALRLEADAGSRPEPIERPEEDSRPDADSRPEAIERADRLGALAGLAGPAEQVTAEPREATVLRRLCAAERKRVTRSDTIDDWQAVVADWTAMRRPYPAAYAGWRLAGVALRTGQLAISVEALQVAGETANALPSPPLVRRIDALANDPRLTAEQVPLTPRELQVLQLVSAGLTNREIANGLFISERTVAVHVYNLTHKLKAGNRTEAANIARQRGLVVDTRPS